MAGGPGRAATGRRRASPRFKLAGKKCRLDVLRGRLGKAGSEMVEGRPRICFGGRQALRDGDVDAWRAKRRSHIFLVGSKSEGLCGNQLVHWDGAALRLRLPDAMGGGYAILHGVRFRYGQAELLRLLERNRDKVTRVGMTWLVFLGDDNCWHAHVTVEEPVAEVVTDVRHGVVAVDLNVDHLAVTLADRCGNSVGRLRLAFPEAGTDAGRAAVMVGDAAGLRTHVSVGDILTLG